MNETFNGCNHNGLAAVILYLHHSILKLQIFGNIKNTS